MVPKLKLHVARHVYCSPSCLLPLHAADISMVVAKLELRTGQVHIVSC